MDILDTIEYILHEHDEAGFTHGYDYKRIGTILEDHGITMPWHLVRDIIGTLHQNPSGGLEAIPIYDVDWAMRGFRIIIVRYDAGETREDIVGQLEDLNYGWTDSFVRQIIRVHGCWLEDGNDVVSW